jgi:CheY-like chemotaxis protein
MRPRVRLVHWNAAEAWPRVEQLGAAGYAVDYDAETDAIQRGLRTAIPDAVVVDLGRLPSHGMQVALALRQRKATRHVPVVFVGGDAEKTAKVRAAVPGASFSATWSRLGPVLARAVASPPRRAAGPGADPAGYAATPLARKLGIKAGDRVVLVDAPEGFERTLGSLPDGVDLRRRNTGDRDLTLWFVTSTQALVRGITWMRVAIGTGALWIAWPKQKGSRGGAIRGADVRKAGLDAGLVDYKVCAIDPTWSGLKFTRRRS